MRINIDTIKEQVKTLAERHQLSLVILFGSQVTGKIHAQSDVDLAFLSEKRFGPMETARMQFDFSEKLKIKELELVDLKTASPLLLKQIAQKSILLYENGPFVFAQFKIYAFKRYMEAQKLLSLREASLNKFLQKHGR